MAKMELEELEYYVSEMERERTQYRKLADQWESMWALDLFDKDPQSAIEEDGQEQVTLATPYNTVNLAERLITTRPEIECPSAGDTELDYRIATKKERWLNAMWQRANKQARKDLIGAAWWQALVRGRGVFEIKWVDDVVPKRMKKRRMPMHIRVLDPLNCGFRHGELYTEMGYHKYRQVRKSASQRYPGIKKQLYEYKHHRKPLDDDEVEIIDFWWIDYKDGSIWNAVLCDHEFAKKPTKTDYCDIPLVEFMGDDQPSSKLSTEALSILHPIKDLWPYQCRLASQIGTGLLWGYWPFTYVSNEFGAEVPDTPARPGEHQVVPHGTKYEQLVLQGDNGTAQQQMGIIQQQMNEATFPPVLFGESPGAVQAGYAVNLMGETAKSRTKKPRRNLENAIELVNEIALGLLEEFGEGEVNIWGEDARLGGVFTAKLTPEEVDGYYENHVRIAPYTLTDEIQKATLGIRLADGKYISRDTLRDKFIPEILPIDEERRVRLQEAMDNPQMLPAIHRKTLADYFGPDWQTRLGLDQNEMATNGQANGMTPPVMPPDVPMMPPEGGQMPPMQGDMGMGGGPMPPGMGAGPPIQPEAVMGGMMPPQVEGQLTEDILGNLPPEVFQALVDEGFSEQEIMNQMAGPPGGF